MVDLDALINSVNIVDFISQYVELEEKNGEYWGLSPLKEEKTPSFSVRESANRFYDFSSGIGGSVFTFIKSYYNCSNSEAIHILEDYCSGNGIRVNDRLEATSICRRFKPKKSKKPTTDAPVKGTAHFGMCKKSMAEYESQYELDWEKMKVWEDEEIDRETLIKYKVMYDNFSDRIVYPIINLEGEIENIGGRTLDKAYKEKGLKKYCYFYNWENGLDVIYGLWNNIEACKRKKEIILFEGVKSVLKASSWGIENTGAILTSHLSSQQMKILAKLGVRVVFALDKDVDIKQDRHIQSLKNYVNIQYICDRYGILDEKDSPVDKGADAFRKLYDSRNKFR